MGKYVRKGKVISGVVAAALVESPQKPFLGVRTRARALALQRLQKTPAAPATPSSQQSPTEDPYAYLQLRSRRLERNFVAKAKPAAAVVAAAGAACPQTPHQSPNNAYGGDGKPEETSGKSSSQGSVSMSRCFWSNRGKCEGLPEVDGGIAAPTALPEFDGGVEASFGENVLEPENSRSPREFSPCSLMQDSESLEAPGSTTRHIMPTSRKNRTEKIIPNCNLSEIEMHEFFSLTEQTQQRMFQIKYNYDVVNDRPLPGRYEWMKKDA